MSDTPAVVIRPMTSDDVEAAGQVQVAAFNDLDVRTGVEPDTHMSPERAARIAGRLHHFISHDPGGSWVATVDDQLIGSALAQRREQLWGLSLLVVDPAHQSSGAGRRLLDATLSYAEDCDTAIIVSSTDVRAMRAYATSGFDLFPQVKGTGRPQNLPALGTRIRAGNADDFVLMDEVDRIARGAPHGPDHPLMAELLQSFVIDDVDGRGYVWIRKDGEIFMLAATEDDTATALLWQAFAYCNEIDVATYLDQLNAEQQWAIRVAYSARLEVQPAGPVFWRGRTPPPSYLASGAYL